jgi:LAO/AO transport system kinase
LSLGGRTAEGSGRPPDGTGGRSVAATDDAARDAAVEIGRRLRKGDRSAAPAALNLVEDRSVGGREAARALLAELSPAALGDEAGAHLIGVTGPPGAGKSSLLSALVAAWRASGRTVAVLAVDPSSKRSGGSLLGDRARIEHDPGDDGVLIRSTAAAGRLGGLAVPTRAAAQALAAAFDVVVVETVGVGQSETDVEELCDTVAVVVQPGSGDTLQFLKAGIMEVPDLLVITKSDLGDTARRARSDLAAALGALGESSTPVLSVSSVSPPQGIDELVAAIDDHRRRLDVPSERARARRMTALTEFATEWGERGLRAIGGRRAAVRRLAELDGALDVGELVGELESAAGTPPR